MVFLKVNRGEKKKAVHPVGRRIKQFAVCER